MVKTREEQVPAALVSPPDALAPPTTAHLTQKLYRQERKLFSCHKYQINVFLNYYVFIFDYRLFTVPPLKCIFNYLLAAR